MKKTLQIVVLAKDRKKLLEETIDSILIQDDSEVDLEIVISDNSETDDIENLLSTYQFGKKNVKYLRRQPPISHFDHFQTIINESNSDYLVMFHDDDIMHQDYVKVMCPILSKSSIAALGCNAFMFKSNVLGKLRKMHSFKTFKIFDKKKDFLECYLVSNGGVAPYPGYIYKTKYLQKIPHSKLRSSTYGDVVFLSSFIDHGSIGWVQEPLMYYRIHSSSSSSKENILGRKLLLKYMVSQGVDPLSTPVFLYKYLCYLNWFRQQGSFFSNISKWRYRLVAKFLLFKLIKVMQTSYFWFMILRKLKIMKY